jgi:hypothetical protein
MGLSKISLLLFGVAAIATVALCLSVTSGLSQSVSPSPVVGPTAYMPGASPTAAPGISTETRNVSTPIPGAGAPAPSVTVKPVTTMAPSATAAGAGATSAKIVNYGTTNDTLKRGERATGFITIKNTGGTTINDITASVSADASLPVVGSMSIGKKDYTFNNLNIKPGETKRIQFTVDIPSEYKGVSTAGDYNLHVTVKTGNTNIGSFSKSVQVK